MNSGTMSDWVTAILLLVGAAFMLLAAIGVVRMPDVLTRMQATSKAATLGVSCALAAVAVHFGELSVTTRAVAVILFTFLTAPVGAHMIGRAAYLRRAQLWRQTLHDDLRGRMGGAQAGGQSHAENDAPPPDASPPPPPALSRPGKLLVSRPGGETP